MNIDQESAVRQFLEMASLWQRPSFTAAELIPEFVAFYRDFRIEGCDLKNDGDMLLLQWGAGRQPLIENPADLRQDSESPDGEIEFEDQDSRYLDFTRQMFVPARNLVDDFESDENSEESGDEADFDDLAIQMSVTLVFGPADGTENAGNLWVSEPRRLEYDLKKHAAQPLVASLLHESPRRIVATVNRCG
jgi:hypothetical protein